MAKKKWESEDTDGAVLTEKKIKTKKPKMFKVLLHNDDFTPMEVVTEILMTIFNKPLAEATHIMLSVHHKGRGIAGIYNYEVAETKVFQATKWARQCEAPLLITMEEA